MVIGMGIAAFFASMTSIDSTISHVTHIAGMLVGLLFFQYKINFKYFKIWLIKRKINKLNLKITKRENYDHQLRKKVDNILEKLNDEGWDGLTESEQDALHTASKAYNQNRPPN